MGSIIATIITHEKSNYQLTAHIFNWLLVIVAIKIQEQENW